MIRKFVEPLPNWFEDFCPMIFENLPSFSVGLAIVIFQHEVEESLPLLPNRIPLSGIEGAKCVRDFSLYVTSRQPQQCVKNTWNGDMALFERFKAADSYVF